MLTIRFEKDSDSLSSRIRVEASATIANFGPGYDTFGLCLDKPVDVIEMDILEKSGIHLEVAEEGYSSPADPEHNTASVAAKEMMRLAGISVDAVGLELKLLKGVRPGSGLGSSASSAVAGAFGAAMLFDVSDQRKILMAAAHGEGIASAAPHLDNIASCLLGGFTVVLDHEKYNILKITPPDMKIVICLPEIIIRTIEARRLIPKTLPINKTVFHVGWASGIVHGLQTGDIKLVASCIRDEISVPARKELVKGFEIARSAALAAGALSFSMSGSGPAVFCLSIADHKAIGEAMVEGFARANAQASYFIAKPGGGAKLIEAE